MFLFSVLDGKKIENLMRARSIKNIKTKSNIFFEKVNAGDEIKTDFAHFLKQINGGETSKMKT